MVMLAAGASWWFLVGPGRHSASGWLEGLQGGRTLASMGSRSGEGEGSRLEQPMMPANAELNSDKLGELCDGVKKEVKSGGR